MSFKDKWGNLKPSQKRFAYVAGIGVIIVSAMTLVMPEASTYKADRQKTIEHLLTDQDTSRVTLQALAAKIDALRTNNSKLQRQLDQMRADQKELARDKGPSRMMQKEIADLRAKIQTADRKSHAVLGRMDELEEKGLEINQDILDQYSSGNASNPIGAPGGGYNGMIPIVSAMAPVVEKQKNGNGNKSKSHSQSADESDPSESTLELYANAEEFFKSSPTPRTNSEQKSGSNMGGSASGRASNKRKLTIRTISSGDSKSSTVSARSQEILNARKAEEAANIKDEPGTYIPAGSMIEAIVLVGMDAPTSKQAKRDPFPALMRFKKEAILPNRYTADIRECFLITSGYGSLSSERAFLRGETLSCVREDGGVIETRFDSFAVGEDGKTGVRGRLVTKAGALVGKAMLAGFGEGLAKALDVAVVPTVQTGDSDSAVSFQQIMSQEALQTGAVGGVSKSLTKASEYFLDMADEMTPVIEIDAGRVIQFVVSRGVSLKIR